MNVLTWRHIQPTIGPAYHRGYLGKVQLFVIGRSLTKSEFPYHLRSVLFPNTKYVNAAGAEILKQAAEDRAQQMLKDMGVRPDD